MIKRTFTWFLVATTLIWAMGSVVFIGVAPARSASAGDLIKMATNPAVYYLGSDSKRYVFPNEKTFLTWYSDFSSVVTVSQSELESYAIGGNVTYRPGTKNVKITTDPKVYAVEPSGVLRWITTEAIASDLYGANWNKRIEDVSDPFFVNYTVGSDITSATYPTGTLVKTAEVATVYYIDGSTKKPVANEAAFTGNKFKWDDIVVASDLSAYSDGSSVTAAEGGLTTVAGPEVTPPVAGAGALSVALASDTAASATIVQNAQQVKFTKVNFTASSDADVVIDKMTVKRTGLSQDSNFSDIILIDGDDMSQIGNEKSLSSTHTAIFNDDITVKAGKTKAIYLAANMYSTLQAGEQAKLELTEVVLSGGATLSGALPIAGNAMTMNATISIGTVTVAAGAENPSAATKEVGTTDYIFSAVKLTVNSTEDVQVERMRFYQNGTAADADVGNLELLVDSAVVKTVASVSSKEVVFDLSSSPVKITKGTNKEFALRGDILDGSSRTISFDFEKKTDVKVKGLTYGYYIDPTYPNTSTPYFNASDTTISTGTLTVSKATLASTNVAEGGTQVELGTFNFNAQGEPVVITRIGISVTVSGTGNYADVTNVTLYDPDGNIVAGPVDPGTSGEYTATSTDSFTVATGEHKYTVKADLNTDFANSDTIRLSINTPATDITAKGDVTGNTITPSPSSNVQGDTVTIKVGALAMTNSATPIAQTVVAGSQDWVFANIVLDASQSGEDVRVTQIKFKHTATDTKLQDITGLVLFDGTTALNDPDTGGGATGTTATVTMDIIYGTGSSGSLLVTKGSTKSLTLKGDISGSAANTNTHAFGANGGAATAYGVSTGNSITASVTNSDGQTQTITTAGDLTLFTAASNPLAGYLVAGKAKQTVGVLTATAKYENVEITSMKFTVTAKNGGNYDEIDTLYLSDGTTEWSVPVNASTASVTPSDLIIKVGVSKTLTVKVDTPSVGPDYLGTSGAGFELSIAVSGNVAAKGVSSGSTAITFDDTPSFNQFNLFASLPTVTPVNVSTSLANGTDVELYRFKISADSYGDVGFYKATFSVTTDTASVTAFKFYEDPDGSNVDLTADTSRTVSETITSSAGANSGTHVVNILVDTGTDGTGSGGEYRTVAAGASKTYSLKATISGAVSGSQVSVALAGDGAYTNTSTTPLSEYTAVDVDALAPDNFIWSDLNFGNNSTTATYTHEWVNGYRVLATTTSQVKTK